MTSHRVRGFLTDTARLPAWRAAATAAILVAVALSNALSDVADYRRFGDALPEWQPFVWEFSSVLVIAALIPAIVALVRRVPLFTRRWYRAAAVHLVATLPFSMVHVAGMVALRTFAYALLGSTYRFGPPLSGFVHEYRKDFVTYWIIAYVYGLSTWLYARLAKSGVAPAGPPAAALARAAPAKLDRLVVRKLNREFILDVTDVARIESGGNYVTIHANASSYQLRSTLAALAKRLDDRRFIQIHRTQIVNVDHIREIQPWDHGDYRVLLNDGSMVNFSRRYRARLAELFELPGSGRRAGAARP